MNPPKELEDILEETKNTFEGDEDYESIVRLVTKAYEAGYEKRASEKNNPFMGY